MFNISPAEQTQLIEALIEVIRLGVVEPVQINSYQIELIDPSDRRAMWRVDRRGWIDTRVSSSPVSKYVRSYVRQTKIVPFFEHLQRAIHEHASP